ncbi:hypothetical protein E2562_038566 [Oryza meyeriana var. granulata]|uniref:Uncharacterized protein n=1 Tax=Oryza meyeriana var. granulata TaxID=110450 RepID=A0A6G1FGK6_9ORYZ|nr:hypothetical protein E2562_038566 [Oryza meyeriana var. granulata]
MLQLSKVGERAEGEATLAKERAESTSREVKRLEHLLVAVSEERDTFRKDHAMLKSRDGDDASSKSRKWRHSRSKRIEKPRGRSGGQQIDINEDISTHANRGIVPRIFQKLFAQIQFLSSRSDRMQILLYAFEGGDHLEVKHDKYVVINLVDDHHQTQLVQTYFNTVPNDHTQQIYYTVGYL